MPEVITRQNGECSLTCNAQDIANANIYIDKANYTTDAAKAHIVLFEGTNLGTFVIDSMSQPLDTIHMSQFWSEKKNNHDNDFQLSNDHQNTRFIFRFYNSEAWSPDEGNDGKDSPYKMDLLCNFIMHIVPDESGKISWVYEDNVGNQSSTTEGDTILLKQQGVVIANLKYTGRGWCRKFKIIFINTETNEECLSYFLDCDSPGTYSGKVFTIDGGYYNQLPENVLLEMKVIPYFYFDNDSTLYSDCSAVIPQKMLKFDDSYMSPTLIFPTVYTNMPMLLWEVERLGYEFTPQAAYNWDSFDAKFGIRIGTEDVFLDQTRYWSNHRVTRHMLFDIGDYVNEHRSYNKALEVVPFVIYMPGTPTERRVEFKDKGFVLNTEKETFWEVPLISEGELAQYSSIEAKNIEDFLIKYRYLDGNRVTRFMKNQQSYPINTDYWIAVQDRINLYVKTMQKWLYMSGNEVSNNFVCWKYTKFRHEKGEPIGNFMISASHEWFKWMLFTHDYLSQFTHDELRQWRHWSKTSHRYLERMGFTHEQLQEEYTHNSLRCIARYNNLLENFFDLITDVSAYKNDGFGDLVEPEPPDFFNEPDKTLFELLYDDGTVVPPLTDEDVFDTIYDVLVGIDDYTPPEDEKSVSSDYSIVYQ